MPREKVRLFRDYVKSKYGMEARELAEKDLPTFDNRIMT